MPLAEIFEATYFATSIIRNARRIRDEIEKLLHVGARSRKPSPIDFLDRLMDKMVDIVKDYYGMLYRLEKALQSEDKAQMALQQFQKSRDKLLCERRTMAIEVAHVLKIERLSPLHSFCMAVQRIFDVSELQVGSLTWRPSGLHADEPVAPSRSPITLGKFVLAELTPGARITLKRRVALRKQIREVHEFLELRCDEILRNYFEARCEISGDELALGRKQKLRDRFKPRRPRKRRRTHTQKKQLKRRPG